MGAHARSVTCALPSRANVHREATLAWNAAPPYHTASPVIELHAAHFPLLLLDLGGAGRTREDFHAAFAGFHEANRRARETGKRWVLIAATEKAPDAVERRIIAEEAKRFPPPDRTLCAVTVLVIPNAVIRSIVTAVGWLVQLGSVAAAPTTSAAVDLAIEHLRKLGYDCPKDTAESASQWFRRNERVPGRQTATGGSRGER